MPQTAKGKKIMAAMQKEYGAKSGKSIYYASIVKGKVKGAEGKGGTGKLAKAKATYAKKHKRPTADQKYEKVRKEYFGIGKK